MRRRRVNGVGLAVVALVGAMGGGARAAWGDWDTPLPYVACLGGVVASPVDSGKLVLVGLSGEPRTLFTVKAGGSYSLFSPGGAACSGDGESLGVVAHGAGGEMAGAVVILAPSSAPEIHRVPGGAEKVLWLDAEIAIASAGEGSGAALVVVERKARKSRLLARWDELTHSPHVVARDGDIVRWLRRLAAGETVLEVASLRYGGASVVQRFPVGEDVALSVDGSAWVWHAIAAIGPLHYARAIGSDDAMTLGGDARYHFPRFAADGRRVSVFAMKIGARAAKMLVHELDGSGRTVSIDLPVLWSDPLAVDPALDRMAYVNVESGELHSLRPSDATRVRTLPKDGTRASRSTLGFTRDGGALLWVRTVSGGYRSDGPGVAEYAVVRELWGAPLGMAPGDASPRKLLTLFDGVERKAKGP